MPDAFATLQRLLEAWHGKDGKRTYVRALRLLEPFDVDMLKLIIQDALQMRAA